MPGFPGSEQDLRPAESGECASCPAITVYCGASPRARPEFLRLADRAGRAIAERGWRLVYGGGSLGLMGGTARAALTAGGQVIGITTAGLTALEPPQPGLTRLEVVQTMHQRKLRMTELGDAFLVLPGGFGTLDETFEALTWRQLGIHAKPIVLLNHRHYFDPLLAFARQAVDAGLVRPAHLSLVEVAPTVQAAVARLAALLPAPTPVTVVRARRTTVLTRATATIRPGASPESAAG